MLQTGGFFSTWRSPSFGLWTEEWTVRGELFAIGSPHFHPSLFSSPLQPDLKGIITLEDVIEELIGEEIIDETDVYVDVHRRIMVARAQLSYQRQSLSLDQASKKRPAFQRSASENLPHSPEQELTARDVFGQQLSIEAEMEVSSLYIVTGGTRLMLLPCRMTGLSRPLEVIQCPSTHSPPQSQRMSIQRASHWSLMSPVSLMKIQLLCFSPPMTCVTLLLCV